MIAGIIPAPSSWDPQENPEQAKKRFDRVIRIMKEDGYITDAEAASAQFPQVRSTHSATTSRGRMATCSPLWNRN